MSAHRRSRLQVAAALMGAGMVGVLTALQARVNGQLGVSLDDGFTAGVVSFGSGLAIMILLSLVLPAGRRGFMTLAKGLRGRRIPVWMLLGGAAGAFAVATQGLAVGIIGVALFSVGTVAGQTLCALLLDRVGYGPAGVVAVTLGRVAGTVLALAAVAISFTGGGAERVPLWMLILPFIAGVGIAWQQATNGRLRREVGTPVTATLVNFMAGTFFLSIAAGVHAVLAGPPASFPADPVLYLGGALGVVYIYLAAALVQYTGVLLLGLAAIVGQLVSSVVIDIIYPAPAAPTLGTAILMLVVALASVVVAVSPWRRRH